MERLVTVTSVILITVAAILLVSVLLALPTYFLWNWLMPTLFEVKSITLFQALGLNLLARFLFGTTSNKSSKE